MQKVNQIFVLGWIRKTQLCCYYTHLSFDDQMKNKYKTRFTKTLHVGFVLCFTNSLCSGTELIKML